MSTDLDTRPEGPADRPADRLPEVAGVPTPSGGDDATAVSAAKTPWGTPGVGVLGMLLALVVVALGLVGIRDFVVLQGWTGGTAWLPQLADRFHRTFPDAGVVFWGVVALVLGIVLLGFAFGRRPRPAHRLAGEVPMWLGSRDVARLATHAARGVDGVTDVSSSAGRRTLTVTITTTAGGRDDAIDGAVTRAVLDRLSPLARPPRVEVQAKGADQ